VEARARAKRLSYPREGHTGRARMPQDQRSPPGLYESSSLFSHGSSCGMILNEKEKAASGDGSAGNRSGSESWIF